MKTFFITFLLILPVTNAWAYFEPYRSQQDEKTPQDVKAILEYSPAKNAEILNERLRDKSKLLQEIMKRLDANPAEGLSLVVDSAATSEQWTRLGRSDLVNESGALTEAGTAALERLQVDLNDWPGLRRAISEEVVDNTLDIISMGAVSRFGSGEQILPLELKNFIKKTQPDEVYQKVMAVRVAITEEDHLGDLHSGGFSMSLNTEARRASTSIPLEVPIAIADDDQIELPIITIEVAGLPTLLRTINQVVFDSPEAIISVTVPTGSLDTDSPLEDIGSTKAHYVLAEEVFHYTEKLLHTYLSDALFLDYEKGYLTRWQESAKKHELEEAWKEIQSRPAFPLLKALLYREYEEYRKEEYEKAKAGEDPFQDYPEDPDEFVRAVIMEDAVYRYSQSTYFFLANEILAKYQATQYLKSLGASYEQTLHAALPGHIAVYEDPDDWVEDEEDEEEREFHRIWKELDSYRITLGPLLADYFEAMYESPKAPLRFNEFAFTIEQFQAAGIAPYWKAVDLAISLFEMESDGANIAHLREKIIEKIISDPDDVNALSKFEDLERYLKGLLGEQAPFR